MAIFLVYFNRREKQLSRFMSVPLKAKSWGVIVLASALLPLLHGGILWLLHYPFKMLLWVFLLNLTLDVMWLIHKVVRFREQKAEYRTSGGEIKSLIEAVNKHREAIKIREDSLRCLLDRPPSLESWEEAVLGEDYLYGEIDRDEVHGYVSELAQLRKRIENLNIDVPTHNEGDHQSQENFRNLLKDMESQYKQLMSVTDRVISENDFW